jgi:uncharacterized SAM-binding protein YcdF (DUF218 family)
MNIKQKFAVVIIDLLILAELAYSIYMGQRHPEEMVTIFFRTFIPLVVLTLVAGRIVIRKLRAREQASSGSAEQASS